MKDIKEKVRDKNPKIRNPASRLPKELVRSAMLETKEKSRMVADKVGRETGEESPVEYAGNRIERAEQRAGKESAFIAFVIVSPDILFPSLEIIAAMAHPEGILT